MPEAAKIAELGSPFCVPENIFMPKTIQKSTQGDFGGTIQHMRQILAQNMVAEREESKESKIPPPHWVR